MYDIFGGDMTVVMIYALIYHFTATSGGCHSSYQQIAERLKIARMTVYRKMDILIQARYIHKDENGVLTAVKPPPNLYQNVTTENEGLYQNVTSSCNKMLQSCNKMLQPYRNIRRINKDNHLYIHQIDEKGEDKESMTKKRKTDGLTAERFEQAFAEFWTEYPRKVGKATARKAFEKAATDESRIEEIMNGLRRLNAEDFRFRAVNYIPHPSTWLNREGWEDEPTPPTNERAHSTKAAILEDLPF